MSATPPPEPPANRHASLSSFPPPGAAAEPPPPILGQTPPPVADVGPALTPELYALEERVKSSANWFYWIVGLSIVNSLLAAVNVGFGLAVGLGMTQLIDGLFAAAFPKSSMRFLALLVDLIPLGFYALMGYLAPTRRWAFIVGMVFYAIDAALCAMFQQWISLALHAWVLFSFFTGFKAAGDLAKLRAAYGVHGPLPPAPPMV